ncbi:ferredoxin [Streptomyces sp. NPDC055681]
MVNATWTVEVDRPSCLGAGVCASVAPGHFAVEHGKSRPRADRAPAAEELRDAVVLCPAAAIVVRDETGEIVD